ncbi:amino acid ABC transporter permease [Candidatus Viridilinea mediisalina]|uniref:Amino acid ABC transporter permease n=1 Tax=Candidatus Viridilinea mediisalina TaxID=2024553 RepID=A0A2A6RNU8_9CHLR|nr:amino acid ABC transporter permease [Candidatus Viridilinea mediisalina]PDW04539.1 amino acid ABC transporter permease [Candidatus Viridilinea mediisalina]
MATDISQPRTRAPRPSIGVVEWLRQNLFSNWWNSLISIVLLIIISQVLWGLFRWIIGSEGWIAVASNVRLILLGRYPSAEVWRPQLIVAMASLLLGLSGGIWRGIPLSLAAGFSGIMLLLGFVSFAMPASETPLPISTTLFLFGTAALGAAGIAAAWRLRDMLRWPVVAGWLLLYPVAILILHGSGGDTTIGTNLWGGLLLTLLLSVSGIVLSFPLGILLALGRRSKLPVIKWFCVGYIELIRGVPLVTLLFMASLMLPLFLPAEVRIDAVVRAIVAVTLFSAAYLAENVRGGLQSLPRGQTEAAQALGLNPVQITLLITLPQALRAVLPVLVGQFIALFKDTSLVVIIGLTDLLGAAQAIYTQPQWLGIPGGVWRETFFVVAGIYWVFTFTMSRTARKIESNLNVGR